MLSLDYINVSEASVDAHHRLLYFTLRVRLGSAQTYALLLSFKRSVCAPGFDFHF